MKAQIIALSLILMLSLTSVAAQTNLEVEKERVELSTTPVEIQQTHYFKTCSYVWDSASYIGETVKINTMVSDASGKTAEDSVKVEVVNSVISSGSGSGRAMSGDKLEIQINEPAGRVVSGNVRITVSASGPSKLDRIGIRFLTENSSDEIPYVVIPEENCVSTEEHPISDVIEIEVSPEKQQTETGSASYKIIVTDNSPIPPCEIDEEGDATNCPIEEIKRYKLSFFSKQNIKGNFETDTVALRARETKTVELRVKTNEKGTYIFQVFAEGDGAKATARGALIYGQSDSQPPTPVYFSGEGFAINNNSQGRLVDLHLIKDETDLKGKMTFGEESFRIDGTVSDSEVYFSIYNRNDEDLTVSLGEFHGQVTTYDQFLLLKGDIEFETMVEYPSWQLTAISKRASIFKESIIEGSTETIIENVKPEEIVTIKRLSENTETEEEIAEVYVVPKEVEREKILGVIPNPWGEKVVKVQVTEGNEVQEKTVRAFDKERIGNYEIGVGSLENEEAIEVSVARVAK